MIPNLPTDYSPAISSMTLAQRQAVEEDKQRWFLSRRMTKNQNASQIRSWLSQLKDREYANDMARRLNQMRKGR